ncbi:Parkinson disease protein 7 homolog [Procambarus clarkii]|uniref:Parkinson disease protein 7 homolog n=1 Tax=Procambarus clarkii TaxID=6728 RepID=UPI001E676790|nr:Parkinson disease protein 7 homolog [Procambarus clarkii]
MAGKSALVILAEGAEEMEAVIAIDTLRRGGVTVTVAGLNGGGPVQCSRDVVIHPDVALDDAISKGPYDAIVLPGGLKGSESLGQSSEVKSILTEQEKAGRVIGAICAAPAVSLTAHGIGEGKSVTCYPSLKASLLKSGKYTYLEKRVVVDGNLITSQGPGTAFEFGLALVEKLVDAERKTTVAKGMLLE